MIELKNLQFGYNKDHVLGSIDLELKSGAMYALIGNNGTGKSTLLKTIVGLIRPISGSVSCLDSRCNCIVPISYLPQLHTFDIDFPATVEDMAMFGFMPHKGLGKELNKKDMLRLASCLQQTGMLNLRDRSLDELSGGQLQRTLFARMLIENHDYLFLDEPFASIDEGTTQELLTLLKRLVSQGKTVLAVHHNRQLVMDYFDYVIELEDAHCHIHALNTNTSQQTANHA